MPVKSKSATDILAIDGGTPVRDRPLPVRKLFGREERDAVTSLMDRAMAEGSHVLAYGGPEEQAYCQAFVDQLGGGYADGVNSGTNAVYVALAALELEPGSEVIVPAITDPGGVMPVALLGHVPVAADCAPGSFNTDAQQIEKVVSSRTRAIIITHVAGLPVDMDPVLELAKQHGLAVIEDAAQAHGAKYQGRPLGTLGDIAAFSTMFGKHHASGGQGGIVFTQREDLYWSARRHADRGKPLGLAHQDSNVVAAINCNMDELHAAVGRANVAKLPQFVAQRRWIAHQIANGCQDLQAVSVVTERPGDEASYWFLLVKLRLDMLTVGRDQFAQAMTAEGVACASGYPFFPMQMTWATKHWSMPELSNGRAAEASHIRITIHEAWTGADADDVVNALEKVAGAYQKQ